MNKIKPFPVEFEINEDGVYVVSCQIFRACHADGTTIDAALDNLKKAY